MTSRRSFLRSLATLLAAPVVAGRAAMAVGATTISRRCIDPHFVSYGCSTCTDGIHPTWGQPVQFHKAWQEYIVDTYRLEFGTFSSTSPSSPTHP